MLTIFKTTEQGIEQLESMENGTWVKAVDPTAEEIKQLVGWGVDADYVNYSLDLDEMPRMERDDDYTFILIRTFLIASLIATSLTLPSRSASLSRGI
jgi:Mg2+ and Co2+ transporter CorA